IVPIVPTAVIFDFDLAPGGKADRWPTADDAYRACTVASADVAEGSVGAGTGATVGKALGPRAATKGGVGSWAASGGDIVVGALVVLNAVGNILDGSGAILAGARGADGRYVDALAHFARGAAPFGAVAARAGTRGHPGPGGRWLIVSSATSRTSRASGCPMRGSACSR